MENTYMSLVYVASETKEFLAEAPQCSFFKEGDLVKVEGCDDLCEVIASVYTVRVGGDEHKLITAIGGEPKGRIVKRYVSHEIEWSNEDDE